MNKAEYVANEVKRRLAAGEATVVMSVRLARTVDVVGLIAASGYHGFYVDLQHSNISLEDCGQLCTAGVYLGITPMVRVPSIEEGVVARVLDGGAMGIIVPDVKSADEARAVAAWSRFPPQGVRSATGPLALMRHRRVPLSELAPVADAETLLIAMLESPEAIDAAEEIAAVPGIDALFIGSNDLTASLGIPGEYRHPRVQKIYQRAIAAAKDHGKHLLVGGIADPEIMAEYVALGASPCAFTGMDAAFMAKAAGEQASKFLKQLSATKANEGA